MVSESHTRNQRMCQLYKYIHSVSEWGFPFDYTDMRLLVNTYLSKSGKTVKQFKNNTPSIEWVRAFVKRHKESLVRRKCQNIKRSRAAVTPEEIADYFNIWRRFSLILMDQRFHLHISLTMMKPICRTTQEPRNASLSTGLSTQIVSGTIPRHPLQSCSMAVLNCCRYCILCITVPVLSYSRNV